MKNVGQFLGSSSFSNCLRTIIFEMLFQKSSLNEQKSTNLNSNLWRTLFFCFLWIKPFCWLPKKKSRFFFSLFQLKQKPTDLMTFHAIQATNWTFLLCSFEKMPEFKFWFRRDVACGWMQFCYILGAKCVTKTRARYKFECVSFPLTIK